MKIMKRIAVITSGGDAPGMNSAVRAVVREAIYNKLEVFGIYHGYEGLLDNQIKQLNLRSVSGIINLGGTILKTKRCSRIRTQAGMELAVDNLKKYGIEGLIVIGGDGSLAAGERISHNGISVICIPASIDNDIYGTDETIGFDTAVDTSVEAIDKIRDTAMSHERIFIVEVMGREHGFLALATGLASGAEFILVPEIKCDANKLCKELSQEHIKGKTSLIIVFAEGFGNPYELAEKIKESVKADVRVSSLGYIQRGGSPNGRSRNLASQFGAYAVDLLLKNKKNQLVVLKGNKITSLSLKQVIGKEKKLDKDIYNLAQRLAT